MSQLREHLLVTENLQKVFDQVVLLESVITPAEPLQGTLAHSFLKDFHQLSTLVFIFDVGTTNIQVFKPTRAIDQTDKRLQAVFFAEKVVMELKVGQGAALCVALQTFSQCDRPLISYAVLKDLEFLQVGVSIEVLGKCQSTLGLNATSRNAK